MATQTPWSEPDFENELASKLGSDWEERLAEKWGSDWPAAAAREMSDDIGDDWATQPDDVADKLSELVLVQTESAIEPEAGGEPAAESDAAQSSPVDLSQYPWLSTLVESDTAKAWFVRIGVPEQEAAVLAGEADPAAGDTSPATEEGTPAARQSSPVDLSQYPWLSTLVESDTAKAWFVRIGVPEQEAAVLAGETQS